MRSRIGALLVVLMLALVACGARLTTSQRAAGIGALGRGGSGSDTTGGVEGGETTGATTGGTTGGTTGSTTGTATGLGAPLPPGGNGGGTDIGVTGNSITLAVASDASGPQAALFKSTHEAMRAFAAYINSQGGLYGRALKPLILDSKTDTTGNKAAVKDACTKAFALVGSMSAFDNGGAPDGQACGIPDLSAITVNGDRVAASNVYPAYPVRPDKFAIGTGQYIKDTYPDVIKKAAMVYLNAGVTKSNALQRVEAYKTLGFDFGGESNSRVYAVQITEASYTPYVTDMKSAGVQYVTMLANYQSIVRLQSAMAQQEWFPEVRDWDSVAYSPGYINETKASQYPTSADGSLVFLNTNIFEESSTNPEMKLYLDWLKKAAPGAKPDYFGIYAWSAGRLFVKAAQAVGPKLTRKALLDEVRKIHAWDGNGLHAAHDTGNKVMSPCFQYIEVKNQQFTRKDPASGFFCNKGGVINT